ncbi:MAG: succinate dehydrogenase assembly factor 2 [Candidatus Sedimenticola sp. (ex Thyasira tokunagai)]
MMVEDRQPTSIERLQWQCRRGMLELDYLLRDFLDQVYPELNKNEQLLFVRMLDFEDRQLLAWLVGDSQPEEPAVAEMIEKMQMVYQRPPK